MASTVSVKKGGRLRLHVTDLSDSTSGATPSVFISNGAFTVSAGMRIEFMYIQIITDMTSYEAGFDLLQELGVTDLTVLKTAPFYIGGTGGTVDTIYDITPYLNLRTFSTTADAIFNVKLSGQVASQLSKFKLIIGLETIL